MFTFAATFVRMSLLQFYYRLTQDSGIRWFTWALHLSHAFNACICISFVALVVFQCNPVSAYWAFPPQLQKCLPEGPVTLGAGIVNCIADLLVASLPIPIVVKLQMPRRQMIGVVLLLSLGFVVTLAGIIRTCFIWKSLMDSYDEMWYAFPLWIAAAVEIDLAMVCFPLFSFPFQMPFTSVQHFLTALRSAHVHLHSAPSSLATSLPRFPASQPAFLSLCPPPCALVTAPLTHLAPRSSAPKSRGRAQSAAAAVVEENTAVSRTGRVRKRRVRLPTLISKRSPEAQQGLVEESRGRLRRRSVWS